MATQQHSRGLVLPLQNSEYRLIDWNVMNALEANAVEYEVVGIGNDAIQTRDIRIPTPHDK